MASFDKAILPGGEGKITVKINTKGYSNNRSWGVMVYTNDPGAQKAGLSLRANVKVPIHLSSRRVYLHTFEGQSSAKGIIVRGELAKPLTIEPVKFTLEGIANYTIEEIEKGRAFKIRFSNIPSPPQNVRGQLQLKTNYPEKPLLTIGVIVKIIKNTQQ